MEFKNRRSNYNDLYNISMLSLEGHLTVDDTQRLEKIRRAWNFYEGFMWEEIPQIDKPQTTENYCRAFVNKFVSFEFGKGFTTTYSDAMKGKPVTPDGEDIEDFLSKVWDYNLQNLFCIELGQSKSITGDGWVRVQYFSPEVLEDPFQEHPNGMVRVMVIPTNIVFPEYDEHDRSVLTKLTLMYPIEREESQLLSRKTKKVKIVYKQIWTKDRVEVMEGDEVLLDDVNPYGVIPFVQIKNFPIAGRSEGISDLEDLIPLNVELNMKRSDVSEIIDYHSAPITVVFGARVSALEKGANKIWGGLPKDSKVQNLELNSDLRAAVDYINGIKTSMHEIGGIPEGALGGTQQISNTSGVALQFINMPLIERTRIKRLCSQAGLEVVNKMILLVALVEGLITKPEGVSNYDFFYSEVMLPDTLPKDRLLELQEIGAEMELALEDRQGAMERLGKQNIDALIARIDADRSKRMEEEERVKALGLNSGFTNGETPIERVRKEINNVNSPRAD